MTRKVTILIDEDLWTRAKIAAVQREVTLTKLIDESLREHLLKHELTALKTMQRARRKAIGD